MDVDETTSVELKPQQPVFTVSGILCKMRDNWKLVLIALGVILYSLNKNGILSKFKCMNFFSKPSVPAKSKKVPLKSEKKVPPVVVKQERNVSAPYIPPPVKLERVEEVTEPDLDVVELVEQDSVEEESVESQKILLDKND